MPDAKKQSITIYYRERGSVGVEGLRLVNQMVFWGWLMFLICLSKGSTWWTFFCGLLAFLTVAGVMIAANERSHRKFCDAKSAKAYLDSVSGKGGAL